MFHHTPITEKMTDFKNIFITEDFLLSNGFEKNVRSDGCLIEFISKDDRITFIELSENYQKPWYMHVEDKNFMTIGSLDVRTLYEADTLLKLCDYEFKWKL